MLAWARGRTRPKAWAPQIKCGREYELSTLVQLERLIDGPQGYHGGNSCIQSTTGMKVSVCVDFCALLDHALILPAEIVNILCSAVRNVLFRFNMAANIADISKEH